MWGGWSEKQDGCPETKSAFLLPIGKTKWPPKPLIGWHIFSLSWNRWTELKVTWQDLNVPYQVCVFRGDLKNRWWPWPLIGWDIFNFSYETAKWNSTKLDRNQDLNVLYQVCVFQAKLKNKMAAMASDRLFQRTFSTSLLKQLNGIQRNLTGSKISTSSTKFLFFGWIGKTRWPPWPLIGRVTHLGRGWYDDINPSRDIVSPQTEICHSGSDISSCLFFNFPFLLLAGLQSNSGLWIDDVRLSVNILVNLCVLTK